MPDRSRRPLIGVLAATTVSAVGTKTATIALPWFVLTTTGSAARTGIVAAAELIPLILVALLGGPLVDRFGARRSAVGGNLTAGLLVGAVPALHAVDRLTFGVLLALVAGGGAAAGLGTSAERVLLPAAGRLAAAANERVAGLGDGLTRLAGLLAAPLAAGLLVWLGAPAVLAGNAMSFVVGASLLAALLPTGFGADGATGAAGVRGYLADLRDGLGWLARQRVVLWLNLLAAVTNLLDQAMIAVLLPLWARNEFGSPAALGAIGLAFGCGAVLGNAVTTWLGPRVPRLRTFRIAYLICGPPRFLALVLLPGLPPILAVMFCAGLAAGTLNPIIGAVEYERVPAHLQARVFGAAYALTLAGMPVGTVLAGWAAGSVGLTATLLACGALYLAATLVPVVQPGWSELDRPRCVERDGGTARYAS